MRAAPGRAFAPRVMARISQPIVVTFALVAHMIADQGEFRVNLDVGSGSF
jgi:hypothetical protein